MWERRWDRPHIWELWGFYNQIWWSWLIINRLHLVIMVTHSMITMIIHGNICWSWWHLVIMMTHSMPQKHAPCHRSLMFANQGAFARGHNLNTSRHYQPSQFTNISILSNYQYLTVIYNGYPSKKSPCKDIFGHRASLGRCRLHWDTVCHLPRPFGLM